MIIDKLANLSNYRGLSANLDTVIAFLIDNKLTALPSGRTAVSGDSIFINHFGYETAEQTCNFENHRRYIDLHIPLSGNEQIAVANTNELATISYDYENDGELLSGTESYRVPLREGEFMLLLPSEAHIPKLVHGNVGMVDKLVCKIMV